MIGWMGLPAERRTGASSTSTGKSVRETQCHPYDEERVWNDGKLDISFFSTSRVLTIHVYRVNHHYLKASKKMSEVNVTEGP